MRFFAFPLIGFLLCSCDCYVKIEGILIDHKTGQPISGAVYRSKAKAWAPATTDSTGKFKLNAITAMNCSIPVLVEKEGYHAIDSTLTSGNYLLRLIPLNKVD